MLEYDNSAFYYFALTLLVIYILPGTWYAVSEFLYAFFGSGEIGAKARTNLEKEKAQKLKTDTTGLTRLNKTTYIVNLVFLVVAWILLIYLVTLVRNDGEVNTFDPYQILGIESGSTVSEIKKAYRRLSLRYHPDKNIGDKIAEEMFMKIAKAYESLTDETSKENYEKYGNPDGKQALEVSIGLPSIILENPKVVLVLYLIAMVVVIPSVVGLWYANSKQYGEKNIMYNTYNSFYQLLLETHRMKNMPEVMAASSEFLSINTPKPTDMEPMGLLYAKMKSEKLMIKPKHEDAMILRGNLLLHAHLMRLTSTLTPELKQDLSAMLVKSPDLIEGMIEISQHRKWLECSIAAVKFSQCIVQGLWSNNHSLEQLPHITESDVKLITKTAKSNVKNLGDYLNLAEEEKKGLSRFSDAEREDILKTCLLFPKLKIETKLFVEEEEAEDDDEFDSTPVVSKEKTTEEETSKDAAVVSTEVEQKAQPKGDQIYEQDFVTLKITLTRENLPVKKNSSAAPVYAPLFPKTICEGWWIALTDKVRTSSDKKAPPSEINIHAFEKILDQNRVVVHEVRFMAPSKAGTYEMELQVLSDCYLGLDQSVTIQFDVLPASLLPEYQPHPEDLELDNEPTLFEQVMAANVDDSSDDDDDDDEDDKKNGKKITKEVKNKKADETKSKKSAATTDKKSVVVKKGLVIEDVDEESEED